MPLYTKGQILQDRESVTIFAVRVRHTCDGDQILVRASHSKQPYYFEKMHPPVYLMGALALSYLSLKPPDGKNASVKYISAFGVVLYS